MRHNLIHQSFYKMMNITILLCFMIVSTRSLNVKAESAIDADSPQLEDQWKQYYHPFYGYGFAYPADWYVQPIQDLEDEFDISITNFDISRLLGSETFNERMIKIELSIQYVDPNLSLDVWLSNYIEDRFVDTETFISNKYLKDSKNIELRSGQSARDMYIEDNLSGDQFRLLFIQSSENLWLRVHILPKEAWDSRDVQEIVNSIVVSNSQNILLPVTLSSRSLDISELVQKNEIEPMAIHECDWGNEVSGSPITLHMPFSSGTTWTVGGYGYYYGDGTHSNASNDYYSTDWNMGSYPNNVDEFGQSVYPIAEGTARVREDPDGYGHYVTVEHSNNLMSLYGHLSRITITDGAHVDISTKIGEVGSTGNSSGNHLHLSFREYINGAWTSRYGQGRRPSPMATASGNWDLCDSQSRIVANKTGGSGCSNFSSSNFVFFRDANCNQGGGTLELIRSGPRNLPDVGFNDSISSIYVPSNRSVRVFEHDYGEGSSRCWSQSAWDLSVDYYQSGNTGLVIDNTISSIEIFDNTNCSGGSFNNVYLYDYTNYNGDWVRAGSTGLYSLVSNFNDRAESIYIPRNWSVRLYQNDNENTNESACFGGSDNNLNDNQFANGGTVGGQATLMRIYDNSNCTGTVTPPASPSLTTPGNGSTQPSSYDLSFQWNTVSGANEYLLEWWGGPYSTMQPCGWSSSTSCHVGTVAAGNTYSWHVRARNSAGESNWSNTWTFTIQASVQPPSAPNLSNPANGATLNRSDSVNLSWNALTNATAYYAEFWGGPNLNLNSGWITGTNYPVGSTWGGSYQWRVRARNSAGEGPWSETRSLTIKYGAPSGLSANVISQSQINLSWSASADAPGNINGYRIYRNGTGIGTVESSLTTYQDSGLASGTTYTYMVRAYNGTTESDPSNSVQAATQGGAPATPANFRFTGKTGSTLTMSWDDVSNETGYRIFKWNGESFVLVQTLGANATSFTDTGLVCLSDYFYELAAYNSIDESDHAGWISDTTSECVASCPAEINYWKGEYWTNPDLAGSPGLCRDDLQLDFEWEHGSPSPTFPSDNFSVRWTKELNFQAGAYRFHLSHDDGGRIFIDDVLRFDGWNTCCSWEEEEITIAAGDHDIRVEMNEIGVGAHLMMWWEPVSIGGWRGEYYNNMNLEGNPAIVRDDPVIDFSWDASSPHPLVRNDNFSARWTRTLDFTAGEYTFTFSHDDGARLYVDDVLLSENWCTNCVEEEQVTTNLTAGQHTIRYEMLENEGSAAASLSWTQEQDTYEPDNSSAEAKVITSGQPQTHSITPSGDVDWIRFTVSQESNVVLESSGSTASDTEMYLYNSSLSQVEYDDDDGSGNYSLIDRTCSTDPLATGTYYARVNEYGDNGTIPAYQIALTVQPCAGSFAKLSPTNGATGQSTSLTLDWANSANATSYEYCYDTTDDAACSNWVSTGTTSQATISGLANGATYYWQVRANNQLGSTYADNGTWWNFSTSGNPPGVFDKVNPQNGAVDYATRPTLRWDSSLGASRYEYCIDTTNDNACSNWISTGTETSIMVMDLANNTTYYWQVRAVNSSGTTYANGAANAYWNFRTIPPPPVGFNKVAPTNGQIDQQTSLILDWENSVNAARYEYCYDTTNDNACTNWVSTGTTSQVSVSGLNHSTTYYWQSRAVNSAATTYANGSETAFWSFTTQAPIVNPPGAFNRSSPTNNATDQPINPTLDWGDSTGATSYEYCYDTTNDSSCSNWVSTGTTSQVTLSGLSYSTNYYWHVRAVNSGGTTYANGSTNTFWRFTTGDQPVSLPGAFNKSAPQNGATNQPISLTLDWADSTGATAYEYCYDTTNDNNCSNWIHAGTTSQASISGLSYSTVYYWQVRANNSAGTTYANVNANAYWSFTTQVPPGTFAKSAPANAAQNQQTNLTLDWNDSAGATNYEYCYDNTNDNSCSSWTSSGSTSQVNVSGLSNATTYYWQVRAINSAGTTYANGSATAFWSFTTGAPVDGVILAVNPASQTAALGQNFTVEIQVRAGTRQVDGASAYINFNPAHLNVVSITPGTVFTNTLENTHDNAIGQLNFSAGSLSNFPTGTFTLATITFRPHVQVSQTTLTFNSVNPRKSDATFGGASILGSTVNGTVTINQSSTINASVNLQGRPAKPDPSWSVPLTVDLTLTGQTTPRYRFTLTSDNRGAFTLTDIQPGSYRVAVKNGHTLQVVHNITVQTETNTAEFGPLPEGDANNDNYVTLLDFSILASTYGRSEGGQGFDGRADFNEDNYITLLDFSLLATNFGDSGSVVSGLNAAATVGAAPGQYANLIMQPGTHQVLPGETFKIAVIVESGDDNFDSAQASINFDPALLQVVALKGNTTAFPMALLNDFNNTLGTIDYAAGAVENFPHGRVQLVEIEFRAKSTEGTTAITFNQTGVRKSDVAFAGNSVLANIESASILIGTKLYFFVPLVEFGK